MPRLASAEPGFTDSRRTSGSWFGKAETGAEPAPRDGLLGWREGDL